MLDILGKKISNQLADADAVTCAIVSLGGEVVDIESFEKSKHRRGGKSQVLLASAVCRTTKYFLALADNIPRLSIEWLQACLDQVLIQA